MQVGQAHSCLPKCKTSVVLGLGILKLKSELWKADFSFHSAKEEYF